jgi:hypothetical protein
MTLICNVNPSITVFAETQSTLKYADITGRIRKKMVATVQSTYTNKIQSRLTPARPSTGSGSSSTTHAEDSAAIAALRESLSQVEERVKEKCARIEALEVR